MEGIRNNDLRFFTELEESEDIDGGTTGEGDSGAGVERGSKEDVEIVLVDLLSSFNEGELRVLDLVDDDEPDRGDLVCIDDGEEVSVEVDVVGEFGIDWI